VGLLLALAATPVTHGKRGRTVTIQLGPDTGQSVGVMSKAPQGWKGDSSTSILTFGNYVGPISREEIWARTFVLFPLSAIPARATVTSATLQLYVNDWPFDGSAKLGVYRVMAPWDEGLSWSTLPASEGALRASTEVSSVEGWVSWEVTSLVRAWCDSTANHGLMLGGAPTPDARAGDGWAAAAVGRTADNVAHAPRLVILYSLPSSKPSPKAGPADIPEPATGLLLVGGLAALAAYIRLRRH
jgi:hypothetical protein